MPELPEAETIARGLRLHLPGRAVRRVEVLHEDLVLGPVPAFVHALSGARLQGVDRRGKNLVLPFAGGRGEGSAPDPSRPDGRPGRAGSGTGSGHLVVNLGMSGRLLLLPPEPSRRPPSHPGILFHLEEGGTLAYHDVRRFGRLAVLGAREYGAWSRRLGPEPLERGFTARALGDGLAASAAPVRSWLLDQRRVAGVGNIYANEALFLARIHPRTPASRVSVDAARRLHRALRRVLREAIRARGTTLRDYRTAAGDEGSYGGTLRVYGREGHPCSRCGASVERIVFGNRSAFFCPLCQPEVNR